MANENYILNLKVNDEWVGVPAIKGKDGDDGFSPIANVVKVGNEATITITDETGTTTAKIFDGAGNVDDVKVNGTSVVTNKVANVSVPTKTSDITNDSGYITGIDSSDVTTALGYTPYNATNPNGYQDATQVNNAVTSHHDTSKQDTLVSGTNIKTINNNSLLGSGNITIESNGANVDLSNLSATGEAHFVKSSSLSEVYPVITTYVSGTSGYRIWSDGYCEQWGVVKDVTSFSTITFPKTFANSNYCFVCGNYRNSTSVFNQNIHITNITASSMQISGNTSGIWSYWKVCGYLAEGQY